MPGMACLLSCYRYMSCKQIATTRASPSPAMRPGSIDKSGLKLKAPRMDKMHIMKRLFCIYYIYIL